MDEGLGVHKVPHLALHQDKGTWLSWDYGFPRLDIVLLKSTGCRLIISGLKTWHKFFFF